MNMKIDRIVHEPVRLRILMLLSGIDSADFNFLLSTLQLTKGNLSKHIEKLENAGFIKVKKSFKDKIPNTSYKITKKAEVALNNYWKHIDSIRKNSRF